MNFLFKKPLFITFFFLLVMLGAHAWAIANEGYYNFWWLDIFLHFLGGFVVGLFFVWLFYFSRYVPRQEWRWSIFLILISSFAVFIGVQWEFFEFLVDTFIFKKLSILATQISLRDTMADLFLDWMGAMLIGIIFIFSDNWKPSVWKNENIS